MEFKIKADNYRKIVKYCVVFFCLIITFSLIKDLMRQTNFYGVVWSLSFFSVFYLFWILVFIVAKYGVYAKITDSELLVCETFIPHRFVIEDVKRIFEFYNPYFGNTLIIEYLNQNKNFKKRIFLATQLYNSNDIKKLMRLLQEKRPDLELPKQWL